MDPLRVPRGSPRVPYGLPMDSLCVPLDSLSHITGYSTKVHIVLPMDYPLASYGFPLESIWILYRVSYEMYVDFL